uniref:Ribosomal biogenesis protein (NOP56) n=1 Tax=uncultured marine group II/III euryarchaeote AD1000_38_E02 TaxID=1457760 RepID=A0A075FQG4_9EURY|nr:ribosomal biogenesis protein (NOP56) [uncultured marine group II/III euryarchaeote AD1000_38_E02]
MHSPFEGRPAGPSMLLSWDWRLARVFDDAGEVVDESIWNAGRKPATVASRLSLLSKGRKTDEARRLSERFPDAIETSVHELASGWWPQLSDEEAEFLQEATLVIAQAGVAAASSDPDRRLEHLVRAGDEMRASWTTLEARVIEWAGLFLPEIDLDGQRDVIPIEIAQADTLENAADALHTISSPTGISDAEWAALSQWAKGVVEVEDRLKTIESAIREVALEHLPSTSALIGPLLAARMSTTAHGRERLARLPSGTVQVLGAETSFFLHLRDGIPVPKHGHLFQHPWVSRSPRWVRGKIARMLSGKVSIAARLDAFNGQPWGESEVAEIEQKVAEIRQRHPKPTRR